MPPHIVEVVHTCWMLWFGKKGNHRDGQPLFFILPKKFSLKIIKICTCTKLFEVVHFLKNAFIFCSRSFPTQFVAFKHDVLAVYLKPGKCCNQPVENITTYQCIKFSQPTAHLWPTFLQPLKKITFSLKVDWLIIPIWRSQLFKSFQAFMNCVSKLAWLELRVR